MFWNITHEMRHFIIARQKYLISSRHSSTVQANTVLITGVPSRYMTEERLRSMYHSLPGGGVKTVWINR